VSIRIVDFPAQTMRRGRRIKNDLGAGMIPTPLRDDITANGLSVSYDKRPSPTAKANRPRN
jgi:hypothetical protein